MDLMEEFDLTVGTSDCPINSLALIINESPNTSAKWETLANGLGIPVERVAKFRQDLRNPEITTYVVISNILELWVGQSGSRAKLSTIIRLVEEDCEAVDVGESLRLQFSLPCRGAKSDPMFGCGNLSPAFQLKVRDNLSRICPDLEINSISTILKGSLLINLMTGKDLPLFRETIPPNPSYYINRTLTTRDIISSTIFDTDTQDVFLFTGVDLPQLKELARQQNTGTSGEQLRGSIITAKFMTLDEDIHFDKLHDKTTLPVHLLHFDDEKRSMKWIKSRGDMTTLQKHVDDKAQVEVQEEAIWESTSQHPVCISDTPGMGKSVLLARIANELKKKYPDRTVVFLQLSDLIRSIPPASISDQGTVGLTDLLEILLTSACQTELGKVVLRTKVKASKEGTTVIELFLDGFDEVHPSDMEVAFDILKKVNTSLKPIRLWVTTRPHFLEELESCLNTLGYNIKPFDEVDQLRFLTSFWTRDTQHDQTRLEDFAKKCLGTLRSNMNSKQEQDIAGIPLQCLLIGEVYQEEAMEFAKVNDGKVPTILINSISGLFKALIAKKFEKYLGTHVNSDFWGTETLMIVHVQLSLELIFPEYAEQFKNLFVPVLIEDILNVGIVEASSIFGGLRFVHRTFAEYFLAWFVLDRLGGDDEEDVWKAAYNDCFFKGILGSRKWERKMEFQEHLRGEVIGHDLRFTHMDFQHQAITYFLNALLGDQRTLPTHPGQHFSVPFNNQIEMKRIAVSCSKSGHAHIFNMLEGMNAFSRHSRAIFTDDFLLLAVRKSSMEHAKFALARMEQYRPFDLALQIKALRDAVRWGKFSTVEFLLKERKLRELLQEPTDETKELQGLLGDCVTYSMWNSEQEVDQKIQVVRLLVEISPDLLEHRHESGQETPLLDFEVDIRLIIELIKLGANTQAQNKGSRTILHYSHIEKKRSAEDYHQLVECIPKDIMKKLVAIKGKVDTLAEVTPLIALLHGTEPLPATLKLFHEAGADFNAVDKHGHSVMAFGIKSGRGLTTLDSLHRFGADLNWKGNLGQGLLHVAAESGKADSLTFLIEGHGMDVNMPDASGLTPLDYAIKSEDHRWDRFRVGMAIHDKGGSFQNEVNEHGQTLLHVAADKLNLHSVQLLIHLGLNLGALDGSRNTPLHMAAKRPIKSEHRSSIVSHMLDNNAEPNSLNNLGETPFHLALQNKYLDLKTFQLLKSATGNMTWTPSLATSAMMTVAGNRDQLSQEEFISYYREFGRHGAEINMQVLSPPQPEVQTIRMGAGGSYNSVNTGSVIIGALFTGPGGGITFLNRDDGNGST